MCIIEKICIIWYDGDKKTADKKDSSSILAEIITKICHDEHTYLKY